MSDLIERLRFYGYPAYEPFCTTSNEAADEIERLRGDLEVMRLQRDATQASRCSNCERLQAELNAIYAKWPEFKETDDE